MSSSFAESHVEEATLSWLSEIGYGTANGLEIGPDGSKPERARARRVKKGYTVQLLLPFFEHEPS